MSGALFRTDVKSLDEVRESLQRVSILLGNVGSQNKTTIGDGQILLVREGYSLVIAGPLTVDGVLQVDGVLATI